MTNKEIHSRGTTKDTVTQEETQTQGENNIINKAKENNIINKAKKDNIKAKEEENEENDTFIASENLPVSRTLRKMIKFWGKMVGGSEKVGYDIDVYKSEKETADRNNALAFLMKEHGAFPDEVLRRCTVKPVSHSVNYSNTSSDSDSNCSNCVTCENQCTGEEMGMKKTSMNSSVTGEEMGMKKTSMNSVTGEEMGRITSMSDNLNKESKVKEDDYAEVDLSFLPTKHPLRSILSLYFKSCSLTMDTKSLSVAAATLANSGVNPLTNERVISAENVRHCLSMMSSCGMYDYSGEFGFTIGLPAKSGVAGGIFAVIPNLLGIATFSPRLDRYGNSVRGVEFLRKVTDVFSFHGVDRFNISHGKKDPTLKTFTEKKNSAITSAKSKPPTSIAKKPSPGVAVDTRNYSWAQSDSEDSGPPENLISANLNSSSTSCLSQNKNNNSMSLVTALSASKLVAASKSRKNTQRDRCIRRSVVRSVHHKERTLNQEENALRAVHHSTQNLK